MSPERVVMPRWATDSGRNVPRACAASPLGDGNGRKCSLSVRRGTIGRRNGAEMSSERVVMPRWATETGVGVARACGAAPLGDGTGQKCSPSVRRGTVGLRKWGRNVARACGNALLGDGNGRRCRPGVRRGTLGLRKRAEVSLGRASWCC